jgi:hypothetical protein
LLRAYFSNRKIAAPKPVSDARSLSGSARRDEVGDEVRVDRRALSIKS